MEEFVLKSSFNNKEANTYELTSDFDKETKDKINEFSESNDEFFESNDIIEEEFDKLVATETTNNTNHFCIIVNYNNDQNIVQRYNILENHRVQELSST
ncbi:hypothetical protein F8M41_011474 [Gigaspora margarita]|uniref:Uncharacterized protein n=1 Tax=Gigaspora margarita TaxID=4874 RepID=A0A8H3X117_GIGMA|nr:hypothetical protein F8M41_011474 [Gigaspora margarita]